jgi:hypothetical protein
MKQLSLDEEPPPIFRGEKEVNKRKNKNLPQLIFSIRSERIRNKSQVNSKNLEKQIKNNQADYSSNENYSSLEKSFSESENNLTPTLKNLEFEKSLSSTHEANEIIFDYLQKQEMKSTTSKKIESFYAVDSTYSFESHQTFIKDNIKKENYYSESKEKEEKDVVYALHPLDEENDNQENTIRWNAMSYN